MASDNDHTQEPELANQSSFGAAMKEAREKSGYSIERAAMSTRISPNFIEALESQKFDALPGEIFGRGFVRNLARLYQADAKPLIALYDRAIGVAPQPVVAEARETRVAPKLPEEPLVRIEAEQVKEMAGKAWAFGKPVLIAVPVLLGAIWISQSVYQAWKMRSDAAVELEETTATQTPVPPPVETTPLPAQAEPAAPAAPEEKVVLRGEGTEAVDIVVKETVKVRIMRDQDKSVTEELQPETYRFQFAQQVRFYVEDMSRVEVRFKGQTIPNASAKGQGRWISFAIDDAALAKKAEKPKL